MRAPTAFETAAGAFDLIRASRVVYVRRPSCAQTPRQVTARNAQNVHVVARTERRI
jgi:hypothetical protein